jgi:hypothetical protein
MAALTTDDVTKKKRCIDITGVDIYSQNGKQLTEADLEGLMCVHCKGFLREPYQLTECGHRCGKSCLFSDVMKKDPPVCPEPSCGEKIRDKGVRPDKGCVKEIEKLTATCIGVNNGCRWRGKITDLEEHLIVCEYVEACEHCNEIISKGAKKNHYSICVNYPQKCELCHNLIPKSKFEQHQLTECTEQVTKCSFEGCNEEGKISYLNQHYQVHFLEMGAKMNAMQSVVNQLTEDNSRYQITLSECKSALDQLMQLKDLVPALNKRVNSLEISSRQIEVMHDSACRSGGPMVGLDDHGSSQSIQGSQSIQSMQSASSSGYGSYKSSIGSSNSSLGDRELREIVLKLEQDVKLMKPTVDNFQLLHTQLAGHMETIQTVQESVTRHAVAMEEIKLRQDILDVKTTHGVFIWKIPEITRRYRDAQDRRTLSLYSPPFHTSPHGYRMCIRAYLNGDGSGKGQYMSVFFVLMKSEHDSLLTWPFRRAVTFQLLNQENPNGHVTETFMPDTQSPSFQQPQSEMNIASGFPRFAKQHYLKDPNFIKGDAIFIKCKIDLTGMDKLE